MDRIEEVRRIKKEVEGELLRIPGVTGVDVNYKKVKGKKTDTLAIVVYVEKKGEVSRENTIPQTIKGISTDVVERKFKIF